MIQIIEFHTKNPVYIVSNNSNEIDNKVIKQVNPKSNYDKNLYYFKPQASSSTQTSSNLPLINIFNENFEDQASSQKNIVNNSKDETKIENQFPKIESYQELMYIGENVF